MTGTRHTIPLAVITLLAAAILGRALGAETGDAADGGLFAGDLPLLVIDVRGGGEDAEGERRVGFRVVAGESGNRPDGAAAVNCAASIRRVDAPFAAPTKGRYEIRLLGPMGEPMAMPLLGMTSGGRWHLQGSNSDKSMLRRYLAGVVGRELFPGRAPATKYCEMVFHS